MQVMPLLDNLATVVLVLLGAFWLLDMWQVNITPLLASAGIATAAVALASKDTLANFFGGVSIFIDRPYRLGDYIILGSGERGEVVDIGGALHPDTHQGRRSGDHPQLGDVHGQDHQRDSAGPHVPGAFQGGCLL